jgi:L-ascorbate metabolism protein UlaG (beta-lactamase superfamily)
MNDIRAKIHYLYHSGFAVQTKEHFLVFDYYKDKPCSGKEGLDGGVISTKDITSHKNPVVFVSHGHGDHFNPVVLEWQKENQNIRYIISSDVSVEGEKIHSIPPHEKLELQDMSIKTFGSTDLGVSFLISVDGLSIFHAGDLNWWHWKDKSTEEEIKQSESDFINEMKSIVGNRIDIAFFPVDPRIGSEYYLGADRFINLMKPLMFVPMHFGDKYEVAAEFALRAQSCNTTVPMILRRGQVILFRKQA